MTSVQAPADAESGNVLSLDLAGWQATIERNATTAFLACRAALPVMLRASYGRIVNIASVTGPVAAMADEAGYAAGKAALEGLTRALAVDSARHGITVNAVAPGWMRPAPRFRTSSSSATVRRSVGAGGRPRWPQRWRGSRHLEPPTSRASSSSSTAATLSPKSA